LVKAGVDCLQSWLPVA